jgi:hypothetical protein
LNRFLARNALSNSFTTRFLILTYFDIPLLTSLMWRFPQSWGSPQIIQVTDDHFNLYWKPWWRLGILSLTTWHHRSGRWRRMMYQWMGWSSWMVCK